MLGGSVPGPRVVAGVRPGWSPSWRSTWSNSSAVLEPGSARDASRPRGLPTSRSCVTRSPRIMGASSLRGTTQCSSPSTRHRTRWPVPWPSSGQPSATTGSAPTGSTSASASTSARLSSRPRSPRAADTLARPAVQARQLCDAAARRPDPRVAISSRPWPMSEAGLHVRAGRAHRPRWHGRSGAHIRGLGTRTWRQRATATPRRARRPVPGAAARSSGRGTGAGAASRGLGGGRRWWTAPGLRSWASPASARAGFAAEFAVEAHADGAVVLSGRSFEESIVPYQPFVEALRQYVADCRPSRAGGTTRRRSRAAGHAGARAGDPPPRPSH